MKLLDAHELRRALATAIFVVPPCPPAPGDPICRECGCWDLNACLHGDGEPCGWVEEELCSVCAARLQEAADRALSGFDFAAGRVSGRMREPSTRPSAGGGLRR